MELKIESMFEKIILIDDYCELINELVNDKSSRLTRQNKPVGYDRMVDDLLDLSLIGRLTRQNKPVGYDRMVDDLLDLSLIGMPCHGHVD
ncbi:unnamed protein product [Rotaria magnacalcarata]|uniref:Uncharacterized protein n=2 Tax=Rotaria magnacalcarata TaxID=392030 RepID=A0A816EAF6_9BILA|nr:unnamed protein product [Rotaria magnacalcarata]